MGAIQQLLAAKDIAAGGGGSGMPTYVAAGSFQALSSAVTVDIPAGDALNDILVMVSETANEVLNVPTDWAHAPDSPVIYAAATTRLNVMWKRAGSSESDVLLDDPGDHTIVQMFAIRGCVTTGDPWDDTSASTVTGIATSGLITIPGVTTTGVDRFVFAIAFNGQNATINPFYANIANASLANLTTRQNQTNTVGNGGGFLVVTGEKATAGATGNTTCDNNAAGIGDHGLWTGALKPD